MTSATKRRPPAAGIGRKKGVPNKTTASVKLALTEAFKGLGGVPALLSWAKSDPSEFYKLWAKMLPQEVTVPDGSSVQAVVILAPLGTE